MTNGLQYAFPRIGWYTYYQPGTSKRGVPDLMFFLPGERLIWVEGKAFDKPVSQIQGVTQTRMAKLGQRVFVARWTTKTRDERNHENRVVDISRRASSGFLTPYQSRVWSDFNSPAFWEELFTKDAP